jgi:dTDP-4-amino-4,6-dideoxygalactose transaminase
MKPIPFNKPYIPLASVKNLAIAAMSGTIAGNGTYTKRCHRIFEERFGFNKVLLTTSCSDALEMAAILCRIEPGDEVIMPSFTFMSTANAFLLRGAKVVFADTLPDIPNIDPAEIEKLITPKTRAIVVVHYSGLACDMDPIMEIAGRHGIKVVEDAAHAFDSCYRGRPLGSIGHYGTFSFHETKNIISGEGGLLVINQQEDEKRGEIIWEKGTNRASFYRGEVDKYGWVDIGSSFLPADTTAALLYTQLCIQDVIQNRRKKIWRSYFEQLEPLEEKGWLKRPVVPGYATVNGNMFYILAGSHATQVALLNHLKNHGVHGVFHYFPLHSSPYFSEKHDGRPLPNTDHFSSCLVRLPFFFRLKEKQVSHIVRTIEQFYSNNNPRP